MEHDNQGEPGRLPKNRSKERSGQHRLDHLTMHIRQPVIPTAMTKGEFLVIEAQQMQDGGMEIVHMHSILRHG